MDRESEAEENGEEVSGTRIWAKFTKLWPLGIWIRLSWAACHCGRVLESLVLLGQERVNGTE